MILKACLALVALSAAVLAYLWANERYDRLGLEQDRDYLQERNDVALLQIREWEPQVRAYHQMVAAHARSE